MCEGSTVTLNSSISGGTGTTTYQWQSSADNATYNNIWRNCCQLHYTSPSHLHFIIECQYADRHWLRRNQFYRFTGYGQSKTCSFHYRCQSNLRRSQVLHLASGGTWTSSNTAAATINNAGIVTGVAAGSATFTLPFYNRLFPMLRSAITVNGKPTVTVTGPTTICTGSTTTLSPTTGGTGHPVTYVATVTNAGVVTGQSSGSATLHLHKHLQVVFPIPQPINIGAGLTSSINYNGSVCLTATFNWTAS